MALVLNGSGITSANIADGTITASDFASGVGGKVLQVVSAVDATQVQSTSTSNVDVLNTAITPSATSSKILVRVTGTIYSWDNASLGATHETVGTLFRGTISGTEIYSGSFYNAATDGKGSFVLEYLDSPSTTSAQTYTLGMKVLGAGDYYHFPSRTGTSHEATITLMEIGV